MEKFTNSVLILALIVLSVASTLLVLYTLRPKPKAHSPGSSSNNRCEIIHKQSRNNHYVDCHLEPESWTGPFYLPLNLSRSNITEGRPGLPLHMNLILMNSISCEPIQGAIVDIWHADLYGKYSGFDSQGTTNTTFLRGIQITDSYGEVNFQTIYPGWYEGRSVHVHIEVILNNVLKHVGHFYFTNDMTRLIQHVYPYSTRNDSVPLPLLNEQDELYMRDYGELTIFQDPVWGQNGFSVVQYVGINPSVVINPNDNSPGPKGGKGKKMGPTQ